MLTDESIQAIVRARIHHILPELEEIALRLGTKYRLDEIQLDGVDTKRIGLYLLEMQEATLNLGIRTGMDITRTLVEDSTNENIVHD